MAGMGIHGGKRIKAVFRTVAFLIILLGRNLLWYLLPLFYVYVFSILISDFENYISNIIRHSCEKIYIIRKLAVLQAELMLMNNIAIS